MNDDVYTVIPDRELNPPACKEPAEGYFRSLSHDLKREEIRDLIREEPLAAVELMAEEIHCQRQKFLNALSSYDACEIGRVMIELMHAAYEPAIDDREGSR